MGKLRFWLKFRKFFASILPHDHHHPLNFEANMGKRTKKQLLAQQANERNARNIISHTRRLIRTIYVFKLAPKAPRPLRTTSTPSQDDIQAFRMIGDPQEGQKTNLLLRDQATDQPIMTRLSPTSLFKQTQAGRSAEEGYQLFQALKEKLPARAARGNFELGIWHSTGFGYFGFTQHTKGKDQGKAAAALLHWAKMHSKGFLLSLKALLPAEWVLEIDSRKASNKYIQNVFKRQAQLLSPWWTTVTFFDSFTGALHNDPLDHAPSFLFNFGAPGYLVLHEYKIKVWLDHLDVVVFNSHLDHSTHAAGDGNRWAFSGFYRKSVYEELAPVHISKEVLDEILGQE